MGLIHLFRAIFFGRRIKMLGRAGIIYTGKTDKYYINSEVLTGPTYDVVIWPEDLVYFDESKKHIKLTRAEKMAIGEEIKVELEYLGMAVEMDLMLIK